jgi:hypothetical protein
MSYDLIVKSPSGANTARTSTHNVTHEIRRHSSELSHCEIIEGPAMPNIVDTIVLADCFVEKEFSQGDFSAFCVTMGLKDDTGNEESAAAFLDSKWGVTLTTVKLPREKELVQIAYRGLLAFAKAHDLRICDPQAGRDIDLDNPGEVPPKW